MEVAEADLGAGLGAQLRRAREQRGLTVEECAERLYLPPAVVEALESEQFASLGAGVYARGHLRRYAGLLELDAGALEQQLLHRLSGAPDLANIATHHIGLAATPRRFGLLPVALVAAVLGLAVLVWWSMRHGAATATAPEYVPVPVSPSAAPDSGAVASPDATGSATVAPATATPVDAAHAAPVTASPAAVEPTAAAPSPAAPMSSPVSVPASDASAGSPAIRESAASSSSSAKIAAAAAPLVIAAANPRPTPPAAPAVKAATPAAKVPGQSATSSAASAAPATKAPARRATPRKPQAPVVPRETQRDYMNFDF